MRINIESNAKINIGLNIIGKLENGYHLLDMTMLPITLADKIEINFTGKKGTLKISTNKKDIPTDKRNILYKVYDKFYNKIQVEPDEIELYLEKIIPHEAGLGGGSSNGAIFLIELNKFYNNLLSTTELINLGKEIGADIPFFILNKPCRVQGIGEELKIIENNIKTPIVIIKPPFGVSTKIAYENISKVTTLKNANIPMILENLKRGRIDLLEPYIENGLEQGLLIQDKNIQEFRKKLNLFNGLKFFMSGSGSAFFSFLPEKNNEKLLGEIKKIFNNCEVYCCNFK